MSTVKGKGWDNVRRSSTNVIPGNIPECLDELGISARVNYDEAMAVCPSPDHNDSHPSWSINIETGAHNCFACGFKGNFVQLVETVLDVGQAEAIRWALKRGGVERVRQRFEGKLEPIRITDDTTKQINEASLALFTLPPVSECEKRKFTQEDCAQLGVLWNPENESWITPIRDPNTHKLWGWQEKNERLFRNKPRNVRKSQTLFGLNAFEGDTAILVESPLDVVRLRAVGIRGGLASYGVSVSEQQLRVITEYADKLVVALDNDDPGIRRAEEIRRDFHLLPTYFYNYDVLSGNAKDPGDIPNADDVLKGYREAKSRVRKRVIRK